jgi:myo-inositol 2-dehydrogenase / D-chiro-inositol 1-dehydrogenase
MNDPSPYDHEHVELFDAIRSGNTINNTEYGSMSTMTAIMGFMATYSGQFLEWDQALNSDKRMYPHHDLLPEDVNWNTPAPVQLQDDGFYPIPVPGVTEVIFKSEFCKARSNDRISGSFPVFEKRKRLFRIPNKVQH